MKTKTGQLLLQKRPKTNSPISTPNIQVSNDNGFIQRQSKNNISELHQFSYEKDFIQKQNIFRDKKQQEQQIIKLSNENQQKIKQQNFKLTRLYSIQISFDEAINKNNYPLQSQKLIKKNKSIQYISLNNQQDPQKQQQLIKSKDTIKNLQLQNYRLIQQNYILIIQIKKLIQQNKQYMLRSINCIQNLQYNSAVKTIYQALDKLKKVQVGVTKLNGQVGERKTQLNKQNTENKENKENIQKVKIKLRVVNQVVSQFYIANHICKQTIKNQQFEQYQLNDNRESKIQRLSIQPDSINDYQSTPNVHKINSNPNFYQTNPGSDRRLFESQITDPDEIIRDRKTISYNQPKESSNFKMISKQQKSSHKFYGNSNQLYKLLLLQASTIQQFFN